MQALEILAIIWLLVFIASFLAHKTRFTPVLWYLFGGTVLVNFGILPQVMPDFIVTFSELGIIFIMFAIGFEEETDNFLNSLKRSWGIAFFGALAPFLITYLLVWYFWGNSTTALLCGLAMAATAVSLTMVSLKSEGLQNTPAATGIMTSAVLDSITSLTLVAILVPIALGESALSVNGVAVIVTKAIMFFLIVTFIGSVLFPISRGFLKKTPLVSHFNLRLILAMGRGEYIVLALLLIAILVALLAHQFGFHPAIGAYMAGLIIRREYFDFHRDQKIDFHQQAKNAIDNIAFSWIGPVFFVTLGSKLILDWNLLLAVLPEVLLLFIGLFIGQIMAASLAAHYIGHFDWPASWMIGFGMLGRAELAFLVMDIAYVQHQLITPDVFYTLMLTTFLLNCSVPLSIRWWKIRFS